MALRFLLISAQLLCTTNFVLGTVVLTPVELTPRLIVMDSQAGSWVSELDLNQDGTNDIRFHSYYRPWEFINGAQAVVHASDSRMALLPDDQDVGISNSDFNFLGGDVPYFSIEDRNRMGTVVDPNGSIAGLFRIGVAIPKEGGLQYAWFRFAYNFSIAPPGAQTLPIEFALLYDYAYETEIGVPLAGPAAIPEPGAWALLALGGAVALLWRRRGKR